MEINIIPKEAKFEGCTLLTGFHGIGATGYWSVKFFVQKLNAERVAFVDSDAAAPVSSTNQSSLVTPYELLRYKNLVFFRAEAPPFKGNEVEFFREFCAWVIKAGFKEVALIGGLDAALRTDTSSYRIVHTTAYKPTGDFVTARVLEDDHLIVGPVAIMLNYFEIRSFPAYAILAYAVGERVDPRAAATAISLINQHYGVNVDVSPLIKSAETLESELSRREQRVEKTGDSIYT